MDLEKSVPRVDLFGGVDVTLREGKLEVRCLFHRFFLIIFFALTRFNYLSVLYLAQIAN